MEKMTEKKFNANMDYIFRLFENIQHSDISVKRKKENGNGFSFDCLYVTVNCYNHKLDIIIGYNNTGHCKQVYVMVNSLTTCELKNYISNIGLGDFYKLCESSLMETLKNLENWN